MNIQSPDLNLTDIHSDEVRGVYLQGAYDNGAAHGMLGLPAQYFENDKTMIGGAWRKGWLENFKKKQN